MNGRAEIDKAGRLVVPKKMRDALHLTPGTRLLLREEGNRLIVEPEMKPLGLYMKKGLLVYDSGDTTSTGDIDWAKEDRDHRMKTLLHELAGS